MYYLGLDSGGTKTDAVLCREDGCIVRKCRTGAGSITGQEEEKSFRNLRDAVLAVTEGIPQGEIAAFFAGISGGGLEKNREKFQRLFASLLPGVLLRDCGSDAVNVLSSGIGTRDGIIAIAGTGSSVFARRSGVLRQVGGWGYLLGDEGSGYDLGRRAVTAALMDLDGRGEKTLLRTCLEKKTSLRDLVADIYCADAKKILSGFAPLLLEAAAEKDVVALEQLRQAAANLARCILTASAYCASTLVVTGGSVWNSPLYRNTVGKMLGKGFTLIVPALPPVYGAAVQAAFRTGKTNMLSFEENFAKTWEGSV